ncbi:hypothetical protein ACFLU6_07340, partial [Acidobacteriota bacterium]
MNGQMVTKPAQNGSPIKNDQEEDSSKVGAEQESRKILIAVTFFFLLIVSGMIFFFVSFGGSHLPASSMASNPCEPFRRRITRLGLDQREWTGKTLKAAVPLDCIDCKARALKDAYYQLKDILPYSAERLEIELGSNGDYSELIPKLSEWAVLPMHEEGRVDSERQTYEVTVHVWIRESVPLDIVDILKTFFRGTVKRRPPDNGSVVVTLDTVVQQLLRDKATTDSLKRVLETNPNAIDTFDQYTAGVFNAILAGDLDPASLKPTVYFPKSQTQLPWLGKAVIKYYLRDLVMTHLRTTDEALEVICIGWTDGAQVKDYISFHDESRGRWQASWIHDACRSRAPNRGAIYLDDFNHQGTPLDSMLTENCQLSYARAFNGIVILRDEMTG